MIYIKRLLLLLFLALFVGTTHTFAADSLTNQEKTKLTELVGKHIDGVFKNTTSLKRWEQKEITYRVWFETPNPTQEALIDKYMQQMSKITGVKMTKSYGQNKEMENILLIFVNDYYKSALNTPDFRRIFFDNKPYEKVKGILEEHKKRKAYGKRKYMGLHSSMKYFFELGEPIKVSTQKIISFKLVYRSMINELYSSSNKIKPSLFNKHYFDNHSFFSPIDKALVSTFYSEAFRPYIGWKTSNDPKNTHRSENIRKAKKKLTELIVEYLITKNEAKTILTDNGGR